MKYTKTEALILMSVGLKVSHSEIPGHLYIKQENTLLIMKSDDSPFCLSNSIFWESMPDDGWFVIDNKSSESESEENSHMKTIYVVKVNKVFNAWFHQGKLVSKDQIIEIPESPSVLIKDNLILDWNQEPYAFFGVKGEILETKQVEGRDFDEMESWIEFMSL